MGRRVPDPPRPVERLSGTNPVVLLALFSIVDTPSMAGLPPDVWAMMIFSILAFFGVSLWTLVYTLFQEERKLDLLRSEEAIDTHAPAALRDLRAWIEAHPNDPDLDEAQRTYRECVEALQTTDRHFYDWTAEDIERLESL